MPEPTQTTLITAGAVGTMLMGLLNWVFKRQVRRIDAHDERIGDLERDSITKDDLASSELRLESTIVNGHAEIQRTLGAAHNRIDELYRDMPRRAD